MKALWSREHFRLWLAIVGTATILLITAFTLVQQSTRLAANDLPLATAQTAKRQLENGSPPREVVPKQKTNLEAESTVFLTITDGSEHVIATSGMLNGEAKLPPAGTFVYTKDHSSDHFTWQPQSGVRLATYMLRYGQSPNDGFIIAGQSLSQAESRIATYSWLSLAGWLAIVAWASLTILLPHAYRKK